MEGKSNINWNEIGIIFTIFIGILTTAYGYFGLYGLNNYDNSINIAAVVVGILGIICGIILAPQIVRSRRYK